MRPKACALIVVTNFGSAQTCRSVVATAIRPAARPRLGALPSVASVQSGACTIFRMAKLAGQIDSQVLAVSAPREPGLGSLVRRSLRRRLARELEARVPWGGIAGVVATAWTEQAGQAT